MASEATTAWGPGKPIRLGGRAVLFLCFDPEFPYAPPLIEPGPLLWVGPHPLGLSLPQPLRQFEIKEFRKLAVFPGGMSVECPEDAVVHSLHSLDPLTILAATRLGTKRFHVVDMPGASFQVSPRGALSLAVRRRACRRLGTLPGASALERLLGRHLNPPWPCEAASQEGALLATGLSATSRGEAPTARTVHYISDLGPGGAQRQLTLLAGMQQDAGRETSILTTFPLQGSNAHYAQQLAARGVECRDVPPVDRRRFLPVLKRLRERVPPRLLELLQRHWLGSYILPLIDEFQQRKPQVVHCWLDEPNMIGGLAALAAGVPHIVLSMRSVNPSHFPPLNRPWFRETYHQLAQSPRVRLVANSRAGGVDYAQWSDIAPERVEVIYNGFDLESCTPLSGEERALVRRELGVKPDEVLVAGVFRLSEEKRPFEFVQAFQEARRTFPGLQGIHVGSGPLEGEVRQEIRSRNLEGSLRLLGRQDHPWRYLGAADLSLLTSEVEGCPNVSIESQALQVPIVLTNGGGAPETVLEGETGQLCEAGDIHALSAKLIELARDPARRETMGRRGREHVKKRFAPNVMCAAYSRLYQGN